MVEYFNRYEMILEERRVLRCQNLLLQLQYAAQR